jgi:hypothetical protein
MPRFNQLVPSTLSATLTTATVAVALTLAGQASATEEALQPSTLNSILLGAGESFRIGKDDVGAIVKCSGSSPAPAPAPAPIPTPEVRITRVTKLRSIPTRGLIGKSVYAVSGMITGSNDFDRVVIRTDHMEAPQDVQVDRRGVFDTEYTVQFACRIRVIVYRDSEELDSAESNVCMP